jgi:hypothetical protein
MYINLFSQSHLSRLCPFAQETLTFADSTLSNALFDDSQNPQSTLSQTTAGVVDEIFLTLDNAFSEELNNNNEWNIDRNDIKNWDTCEPDVRTNMVCIRSLKQLQGAIHLTLIYFSFIFSI